MNDQLTKPIAALLKAMFWTLLLSLPLAAQRTWIVDSLGGPGVDFLDINVAYAAASRGDTIIVREGHGLSPYNLPTTIGRSIRIVAPSLNPVPVRGRCTVCSVPDGDVVVIDNMDFATESFNATLGMLDCQGLVILSRMYASPWIHGGAGGADRSSRVVLTRMRNHVDLGAACSALSSRVWLLDSDVSKAFADPALFGAYGAIDVRDSQMWVIGCRAEGGAFNSYYQTNPDPGLWAGGIASRVYVAGESTILGGPSPTGFFYCSRAPGRWASAAAGGYPPTDPRASIMLYDGNTTFDNCIAPFGNYLQREFPAVLPGEAIQGQPQSIRVIGPTGSIMSVFASLVHGAPPVELPVGDVWLDPSLVMCVGSGAVDAQRHLTLTTRIPSWLPVGEVLVYQGVSLSPQSMWEISQPGFAVVREP